MPRPKKPRFINFLTNAKYFKPRAMPLLELEEVALSAEEMEALRLKELKRFSHEKAAKKMKISRTSFHRDLESAHQKIADALINNKAIRIERGSSRVPKNNL